jgi:hypothetical protein
MSKCKLSARFDISHAQEEHALLLILFNLEVSINQSTDKSFFINQSELIPNASPDEK